MGQMESLASDWEAIDWCRYVLTIENCPPSGVLLGQGADGKQVPMLPMLVKDGVNIALQEPLRSMQAASDLSNLIRRKNFTRLHCWRDQELEPVKETELVDAQKTLIDAWNKYFAGYCNMIDKAPKSFDLVLDVSEIQMPALPIPTQPTGGATTRPILRPPQPGVAPKQVE
jgi:hypothetical protein